MVGWGHEPHTIPGLNNLMELYYGILDDRVVAFTWAKSIDDARDSIELALADADIVDTDALDITRFPRNASTIVLDI